MLLTYRKKNQAKPQQNLKQTNKHKQWNKTKNVFDIFSYQDRNENMNQPFRKILHREIFIW